MTSRSPAERRAAFDACLDYSGLVRGGRVAANWLPDGRFWFVENAPNDTAIMAFDPKTAKIAPLLDVARTRAALEAKTGRAPPGRGLPFASVHAAGPNALGFNFEGRGYTLDLSDYALREVPGENMIDAMIGSGPRGRRTPKALVRIGYFEMGFAFGMPEQMSPDGEWFATIQNYNLSLRSTADGRVVSLTGDGTVDFGWDVEAMRRGVGAGLTVVYRTISPWSPDGQTLFAAKIDRRGIKSMTMQHLLGHYDEIEISRHTRAGDVLSAIVPFAVNVLDRRPVQFDVDAKDQFLLPIGWSRDSSEVYFVQFSRDMRTGKVYAGDPVTGAVRLLFSETGKTFIRIQHDVIAGASGCTLLPDGLGFLWESERDGWKHLYHYAADGAFIRQVTTGAWPVCDVLATDARTGTIYFTAHHDQARPYDVHLCRVALAGGTIKRLTESRGMHEIQLAPDFGCFVATVSTPDTPPVSEVRSIDGRKLHAFPPADISRLNAVGWTPPEEFSVKAADGATDLWGVIYKPSDFDPKKSYPVLEYIYGGPQVAVAPHVFQTSAQGQAALQAALPELGYVVVILDARGTPERSKAFQDAVYREWRRHVTADHAAALRSLAKTRPWMDLGRVGIYGHSWGGYYTVANLLDNPDLYKAGVASSPGLDPYSLFLYEPYIGMPSAANKDVYADATLPRDAALLKSQLLMIAGSTDVPVWHDTMKMSNALIEAGVSHDFVPLPGQYHGYASPHERYFIEKLVAFFDRHVMNAKGE